MVLSTRVSLQWLPEEPEELTSTLVFSSSSGHFVDVRIYKEAYPHVQQDSRVEGFKNVFQWVIVGMEEPIADTNQIRFAHTVNSQEILRSLETNRPLFECRDEPDIGAFWPLEGTDDRKETGVMTNPVTNRKTEYVEIWRSLNPNLTSFADEVREGYDRSGQLQNNPISTESVFDLEAPGKTGRIIRLGNWAQGIIYDEEDKEAPLSVMRSFFDETRGTWIELIKYGKQSFPDIFKNEGSVADESWRRI